MVFTWHAVLSLEDLVIKPQHVYFLHLIVIFNSNFVQLVRRCMPCGTSSKYTRFDPLHGSQKYSSFVSRSFAVTGVLELFWCKVQWVLSWTWKNQSLMLGFVRFVRA